MSQGAREDPRNTTPPKVIIQLKDMSATVVKLEPSEVREWIDRFSVMDLKDIRRICLVLEE